MAIVGDTQPIVGANLSSEDVATQSSAGNRPTYRLLSGRDAVRFTASLSQYLVSQMAPGVDPRKGLAVVALLDVRADGRLFSFASSDASELTAGMAFAPTNGLIVTQGGVAAFLSGLTDYTVNSSGLAIFSARFSGAEVANWLNGSATKRNGTANSSTELSDGSHRPGAFPTASLIQPLHIGRRLHTGGSPLYIDADVFDLLIVNGMITDEEMRYLEGVVAWDNGAESLLASGHPWESAAPAASSAIPTIWTGPVVARSPAPKTRFLGSPSFLKAADGTFYFLHDFFGEVNTSGSLYVSTDEGATWSQRASFPALFWGKLWQHTDGHLYILSVTREYGDLQILKSVDQGRTWSTTILSAPGGPLAAAGAGTTPPNYSKAPTHPLYHDGHIFFEAENWDPTVFPSGFKTFLLYAPAASDLTNRASWSATSQLAVGAHSFDPDLGVWEGTPVIDDAGQMWIVSRVGASDAFNKACFFPIGWNGSVATMPAWSATFIKDFPGGHTKFDVVKSGGFFWAVVNDDPAENQPRHRSVLTRMSSASLASPVLTQQAVLIDEDDVKAYTGMNDADSRAFHGFQYASIQIDGSTLHVGYRIGWSGANNFHDSNLMGYASFGLA